MRRSVSHQASIPRRRIGLTLSALVIAGPVAGLTAACGSDSTTEPTTAPTTSTSAPEQTEPPTSPTSPASSSATGAVPTSGPKLSVKGVSLHLPDGWTVDRQLATFRVSGSNGAADTISITLFPTLGSGTEGLESALRSSPKMAASTVQPPVTVAGTEFAHVSGKAVGLPEYDDIYGTRVQADGLTYLLQITYLPEDLKTTAEEATAFMAPVLASVSLPS